MIFLFNMGSRNSIGNLSYKKVYLASHNLNSIWIKNSRNEFSTVIAWDKINIMNTNFSYKYKIGCDIKVTCKIPWYRVTSPVRRSLHLYSVQD